MIDKRWERLKDALERRLEPINFSMSSMVEAVAEEGRIEFMLKMMGNVEEQVGKDYSKAWKDMKEELRQCIESNNPWMSMDETVYRGRFAKEYLELMENIEVEA